MSSKIIEKLPPGVKVEEIEIPVPWGHVAGRWWGPRDKQPLIAIHGWQDNAGTWDRLIPLLPTTTSVLCIDLPGQGLSSHYPPGMTYYKFWDGLILIRRIVRDFKWKNISLMGHSLGGALSFMYAASFPNEVDKIICIDIASPVIMTPAKAVSLSGQSIDKTLQYEEISTEKYVLESYDDMLDMMYHGYQGSVTRENCQVLMKRGVSQTKQGYYFNRDPRLKALNLAMMSMEEALEYAGEITCKVLNIKAISGVNANNDDYIRIIEKLKQTADVTFVKVEGTHHVHLNSPEKVAYIVEEFLQDSY